MYDQLRDTVLRLFRAPLGPPDAPSGEHAQVQVMRASRRYLSYRLMWVWAFVVALAFAILATAVLGVAAPPLWIFTALGVFVVAPLWGLRYFGVRVDYDLRYYVITDRSVRVRQGAWKVEERTITFANVQNVRVEQGPIERLFGFSSVRIDTAGGGMVQGGNHAVRAPHGVELAGIEDAARLRDTILDYVRRQTDSGLGEEERARRSAAGRAQPWSAERVAGLREVALAARRLRSAAERLRPPRAPEPPVG